MGIYADIEENYKRNKRYKRSKVDSVLYCPYCGHGFKMNYNRYIEQYKSAREGRYWSKTICNYCNKSFNFRNITPQRVREGYKAVKRLEDQE